jgi:hypothetical protein
MLAGDNEAVVAAIAGIANANTPIIAAVPIIDIYFFMILFCPVSH